MAVLAVPIAWSCLGCATVFLTILFDVTGTAGVYAMAVPFYAACSAAAGGWVLLVGVVLPPVRPWERVGMVCLAASGAGPIVLCVMAIVAAIACNVVGLG